MGNIDKLKQIIGMVGKDPYEGMTPQEKKLAKLESVFKLLDDGVTKQEFEKNLTEILKLMKAMKENSAMEVSAMKDALRASLDNLNGTHETLLNDAKSQIDSLFVEGKLSEIDKKQNDAIARLDERLSTLRDGVDGSNGKDADEETIVERVLSQMPKIPEFKEELAETVKEELDQFKKEIETRFNNMPTRVGAMGGSVVHKFIDDDTLVGTKNDVNTVFTLSKEPVNGSLKLYRGGARQRVTEDYTLSGRTVTFIIPPSANEILCADYRHF
jgi:uncharacterized phage infection (PIP) family protein YhgE